jgi:feruloyl esterase
MIAGSACDPFLIRGYACIVSDFGHIGRGAGPWASHNLQAQIDLGYRGAHVMALSGKAIVERFYSRAAARSYFMGCSGGGRQGMMEAQRFPWDFDGIIAGAPDLDAAEWALRSVWGARSLMDEQGKPILAARELQILHRAALAACDLDDGVKDGIIGNPAGCAVDPSRLLCKAGATGDCLSRGQVDAAIKIYTGPVTSSGERTSLPVVFPGSELAWSELIALGEYTQKLLEFGTYGASFQSRSFNFDSDHEGLGLGQAFAASNPDLRKFKAAGGKLIAYVGGNDAAGVAADIVDYYQISEKVMGGRERTQDFFRLFVVPGMGHCVGGPGASEIDYLGYLEAWVEKAAAPNSMIGAHRGDRVSRAGQAPGDATRNLPADSFTRPVYPFPLYPKYKGSGDPNDARSFEATSSGSKADRR